ncbi:MAG TPA: toxin-antitoxin system HicB family antitoxin [Roseiarcus sp.]
MDAKTSADKVVRVKTRISAYALRLPASIKAEAEKIAKEDGTSLNQFVASAVAEKVAAIRTLNYFAPFKARANLDEFDRIMRREFGAPPQPGDEIPED